MHGTIKRWAFNVYTGVYLHIQESMGHDFLLEFFGCNFLHIQACLALIARPIVFSLCEDKNEHFS